MEGMIKPAIVVIGFNRIDSIKRLLKSIKDARYPFEDITLIISVDFQVDNEKNREVMRFAKEFEWKHGKKIVRTFDQNQGLKYHFLQCADYSIEYGAAIILEDDVFVSDSFYVFSYNAVNRYSDNKDVLAISLYSQLWDGYANGPFVPMQSNSDVYASQIECSWGECYIGKEWIKFREWMNINDHKLNIRNDVPKCIYEWNHSYSKYIINYIVENNKWFITPYASFSTNFSDIGTHATRINTAYQVPMQWDKQKFFLGDYNKLSRYNIFFQPVDLEESLSNKYHGKIVSDYYGIRDNYEGYQYCISASVLNYKIIDSYGLMARPWELNCYLEIEGNDIFVYDLSAPNINKETLGHRCNLIEYNIKNIAIKDLLPYTYAKIIEKLNMASLRRIGRFKDWLK